MKKLYTKIDVQLHKAMYKEPGIVMTQEALLEAFGGPVTEEEKEKSYETVLRFLGMQYTRPIWLKREQEDGQ